MIAFWLKRSVHSYRIWGARRKVAILKLRYASLLDVRDMLNNDNSRPIPGVAAPRAPYHGSGSGHGEGGRSDHDGSSNNDISLAATSSRTASTNMGQTSTTPVGLTTSASLPPSTTGTGFDSTAGGTNTQGGEGDGDADAPSPIITSVKTDQSSVLDGSIALSPVTPLHSLPTSPALPGASPDISAILASRLAASSIGLIRPLGITSPPNKQSPLKVISTTSGNLNTTKNTQSGSGKEMNRANRKRGVNAQIDTQSMLDAAQAISQEIQVDRALMSLMSILLSCSGAESGLLISKRDQRWVVEAKATPYGCDVLPADDEEHDGVGDGSAPSSVTTTSAIPSAVAPTDATATEVSASAVGGVASTVAARRSSSLGHRRTMSSSPSMDSIESIDNGRAPLKFGGSTNLKKPPLGAASSGYAPSSRSRSHTRTTMTPLTNGVMLLPTDSATTVANVSQILSSSSSSTTTTAAATTTTSLSSASTLSSVSSGVTINTGTSQTIITGTGSFIYRPSGPTLVASVTGGEGIRPPSAHHAPTTQRASIPLPNALPASSPTNNSPMIGSSDPMSSPAYIYRLAALGRAPPSNASPHTPAIGMHSHLSHSNPSSSHASPMIGPMASSGIPSMSLSSSSSSTSTPSLLGVGAKGIQMPAVTSSSSISSGIGLPSSPLLTPQQHTSSLLPPSPALPTSVSRASDTVFTFADSATSTNVSSSAAPSPSSIAESARANLAALSSFQAATIVPSSPILSTNVALPLRARGGAASASSRTRTAYTPHLSTDMQQHDNSIPQLPSSASTPNLSSSSSSASTVSPANPPSSIAASSSFTSLPMIRSTSSTLSQSLTSGSDLDDTKSLSWTTSVTDIEMPSNTPKALTALWMQLPLTLFNFVLHTGKSPILNDASTDRQFSNDPYVQHFKPKSIMIVPFHLRNEIVSVLYLENNLTRAAFTTERLDMVRLLSSQAAISLENARLYTQLERHNRTLEDRVERRTRQLREAQGVAERANMAKSLFLSTMSHEIRTPLNGVIGTTHLLLEAPQSLDADQTEMVETIRDSGQTLLSLINDVLDLTKIESGKFELDLQPFDIRHCIESSMDVVAVKALSQGIDLAYFTPTSIPVTAIADVTRVRQILTNLLSNAVKFTAKGEVVVTVESTVLSDDQLPASLVPRHRSQSPRGGNRATATATTTATAGELPSSISPSRSSPPPRQSQKSQVHELHFAVRDTGIGIPLERAHRLFQIFSQVNTDTSKHYGGTGLGLAISRHFAEMMGGQVWVESMEGKGSIFHFTIRVPCSFESPPDSLIKGNPVLSGKSVWCYDPSSTIRQQISDTLSHWGMTVTSFATSEELQQALDKFDRTGNGNNTNNTNRMNVDGVPLSSGSSTPPLISSESKGLISLSLVPTVLDRSPCDVLVMPLHLQLGAKVARSPSASPGSAARTLGRAPSSSPHLPDGMKLVRRIRMSHSKRKLPIVLMCALSERKQEIKTMINAFGSKPVKPGQLLKAMLASLKNDDNGSPDVNLDGSRRSSNSPLSLPRSVAIALAQAGAAAVGRTSPRAVLRASLTGNSVAGATAGAVTGGGSLRGSPRQSPKQSPQASGDSSSRRLSGGGLPGSAAAAAAATSAAAGPPASKKSSTVPPTHPSGAVVAAKKPVRPLNILVAEDNLVNQKVIRQMLKMQGYVIDIVDNGKKAVDTVLARAVACQTDPSAGCYDLVLMDVQVC
jgi:signal transduction histidine kinase/DNA-binding response OmpR family regulator